MIHETSSRVCMNVVIHVLFACLLRNRVPPGTFGLLSDYKAVTSIQHQNVMSEKLNINTLF